MMTLERVAADIGGKLLALSEPSVSRHLDELIEDAISVPNYGVWCFEVFLELVRYLRASGEHRVVAWIIPVSISDTLCVDDKVTFETVVSEYSPATVYLLSSSEIFSDCAEEYRNAIALPRPAPSVRAIFRSFRDQRAAEQGWEYSNDIYMWSSASDDPPQPVA